MPFKKPSFNNKGGRKPSEDTRVSVCIPCKKGIYSGQEYEWSRGYGLIHKGCLLNEIKSASKAALP